MFFHFLMMYAVKPEPRRVGDTLWLEYNAFIKAVGWISLAGILALLFFTFRADADDRDLMFKGLFVVVLLGLPCFLETVFVRIGYDSELIRSRSPWRRKRTIPWEDVTSYRWVESGKWWEVSTQSHGKLRAHMWLSGAKAFCAELDRRGVPRTA